MRLTPATCQCFVSRCRPVFVGALAHAPSPLAGQPADSLPAAASHVSPSADEAGRPAAAARPLAPPTFRHAAPSHNNAKPGADAP